MPNDADTAKAFIAQHYSYLSGVDTEVLRRRMALQCLSNLLVVNEVFNQLSSLSDQVWTGFYLIKSLEDAGLY